MSVSILSRWKGFHLPRRLFRADRVTTGDRLFRDKDWINGTAGVANAGISLAIGEPESIGWPKISSLLKEYGFIAFSAADKPTVFDQIRTKFGDEGDLPY